MHKEIAEIKTKLKEVKEDVTEINQRLEEYYSPELEKHAHRIKALEVHTGIQ